MAARPAYKYRVVSHNGAGTYGLQHATLQKAKHAAIKVSAGWVPRSVPHEPLEIQRELEVSRNTWRYWSRKGHRWILWDPHLGIEERHPDFVVYFDEGVRTW